MVLAPSYFSLRSKEIKGADLGAEIGLGTKGENWLLTEAINKGNFTLDLPVLYL
jgi:hypothetical protein